MTKDFFADLHFSQDAYASGIAARGYKFAVGTTIVVYV